MSNIFLLLIFNISFGLAFKPENCGLNGIETARQKRIVGGYSIPHSVFPWVVGLQMPGMDILCTGSLISEKHVLISAHCFGIPRACELFRKNIPHYFICHGAQRNDEFCRPERRYKIAKIDFHEDYFKKGCRSNDFAVVTLEREVENAIPICLPIQENGELRYNTSMPRTLTSVGYSKNRSTGKLNSFLRMANLGKPQQCWYPDYMSICTKPSEDGAVCHGDSGGPLSEMHEDRSVIVGINREILTMDEKNPCGHPWSQDTFEAVAAHIDQILSILEPQGTTTEGSTSTTLEGSGSEVDSTSTTAKGSESTPEHLETRTIPSVDITYPTPDFGLPIWIHH